jgi:hypothetical protein
MNMGIESEIDRVKLAWENARLQVGQGAKLFAREFGKEKLWETTKEVVRLMAIARAGESMYGMSDVSPEDESEQLVERLGVDSFAKLQALSVLTRSIRAASEACGIDAITPAVMEVLDKKVPVKNWDDVLSYMNSVMPVANSLVYQLDDAIRLATQASIDDRGLSSDELDSFILRLIEAQAVIREQGDNPDVSLAEEVVRLYEDVAQRFEDYPETRVPVFLDDYFSIIALAQAVSLIAQKTVGRPRGFQYYQSLSAVDVCLGGSFPGDAEYAMNILLLYEIDAHQ